MKMMYEAPIRKLATHFQLLANINRNLEREVCDEGVGDCVYIGCCEEVTEFPGPSLGGSLSLSVRVLRLKNVSWILLELISLLSSVQCSNQIERDSNHQQTQFKF
jgi:hypothetical protein